LDLTATWDWDLDHGFLSVAQSVLEVGLHRGCTPVNTFCVKK
jgi:hypothetical protein